MNTLEICVDAPDDFSAAVRAGVDRIELCSALDLGGLTPTPGMIAHASGSRAPVYAMIRPRSGGFTYSEAELRSMETDIAAMRSAGFDGVVFGALRQDDTLDTQAMARLCRAAGDMGKTLHRAVDELSSPQDAVKIAIELGFERILTSGGASTALEGLDEISQMIRIAEGKIEIMAGSGVSYRNVQQLSDAGVTSFHASCRETSANSSHKVLNKATLEKTLAAVKDQI